MKKKLSIVGIVIIILSVIAVVFLSGSHDTDEFLAEKYGDFEDVKPLNIWLVTDTHYIAKELTDGGSFYQRMIENGDGKYMFGCEEITDEFINQVLAAKPNALIIAGDLTFNGARLSHEAFAKKLKAIEDAGINVLTIPGNHDFTVKRAAKFRGDEYELVNSIDASEYLQIYGDFGINEAIARDETSLSYVAQIADNVRIIAVDVNTVAGMSGILTKSTLAFVEQQLIKAREDKAYVIGVTHQTLLKHSDLTTQGIIFINNDKLLDLYEKYGVLTNLSGHMHIQHITKSSGGVTDVATGSLMTAPNYYGVIKLSGRKMTYEAVSTIAKNNELENAARDFLWNNSYRQGMDSLAEVKNISEEDGHAMASFFADFNVNYIAGRADLIPWDSDVIVLWHETDTFVPKYIDLVKAETKDTENMVKATWYW